MATKWKKWKSNLACVAFVLGVSLLISGGAGSLREWRYGGSISFFREYFSSSDYQNSRQFRDFMSDRLNIFLNMACGDPVYSNYYGYWDYGVGAYAESVAEDVIEQVEQAETIVQEGEAEMIPEDSVEGLESKLTEAQKQKMINEFHNAVKFDQNVLYRISSRGAVSYTNIEQGKWDGSKRNLPEGYNFYLYFDGEKAVVRKDGQDLDLYGDGIYREGEDWCIPGYKNFTAKEKWKDVQIAILVAEKPIRYLQSDDDRYDYRSGSGLYEIYQDYFEEKSYLFRTLACLAGGLVGFVLYLLLRNGKRELNKRLAAVTAKMWFEWKILLGVVLPVLLFVGVLQEEGVFTYAYDAVVLSDIPYYEYASELSYSLVDMIPRYIEQLLLAFWLLYAFIADVCQNRDGYKKGIYGKCAAVLKSRDLKLPLSKRLVKRTYVLFGFAAALPVYLLIVFCTCLFLDYRMLQAGAVIWWMEGAFALAAGLLAAVYFYQKKNRKFAEEITLLADQISGIRGGKYEAGAASAFEDADLRRMAEELEDIRQGLETAVEERISSERMKVELVANVSHDIKTPLTSIISYIQLLKQEEGLPDDIADYIRILDEKSERLKNMVQDVFAVSKAASGQLSVELKELDLCKLLYQTLADMEEPITKSPVTVKTEIPKEPVMVCTDGQRMYRVFQNLIGNAIKYSLEGSRVYVTLKEEGALAVASVKNTSSEELNREIDFAERFTRGDESRTDGGSGLGLSIARSFTEACGGTFELEIIADLFVVTVSLPLTE